MVPSDYTRRNPRTPRSSNESIKTLRTFQKRIKTRTTELDGVMGLSGALLRWGMSQDEQYRQTYMIQWSQIHGIVFAETSSGTAMKMAGARIRLSVDEDQYAVVGTTVPLRTRDPPTESVEWRFTIESERQYKKWIWGLTLAAKFATQSEAQPTKGASFNFHATKPTRRKEDACKGNLHKIEEETKRKPIRGIAKRWKSCVFEDTPATEKMYTWLKEIERGVRHDEALTTLFEEEEQPGAETKTDGAPPPTQASSARAFHRKPQRPSVTQDANLSKLNYTKRDGETMKDSLGKGRTCFFLISPHGDRIMWKASSSIHGMTLDAWYATWVAKLDHADKDEDIFFDFALDEDKRYAAMTTELERLISKHEYHMVVSVSRFVLVPILNEPTYGTLWTTWRPLRVSAHTLRCNSELEQWLGLTQVLTPATQIHLQLNDRFWLPTYPQMYCQVFAALDPSLASSSSSSGTAETEAEGGTPADDAEKAMWTHMVGRGVAGTHTRSSTLDHLVLDAGLGDDEDANDGEEAKRRHRRVQSSFQFRPRMLKPGEPQPELHRKTSLPSDMAAARKWKKQFRTIDDDEDVKESGVPPGAPAIVEFQNTSGHVADTQDMAMKLNAYLDRGHIILASLKNKRFQVRILGNGFCAMNLTDGFTVSDMYRDVMGNLTKSVMEQPKAVKTMGAIGISQIEKARWEMSLFVVCSKYKRREVCKEPLVVLFRTVKQPDEPMDPPMLGDVVIPWKADDRTSMYMATLLDQWMHDRRIHARHTVVVPNTDLDVHGDLTTYYDLHKLCFQSAPVLSKYFSANWKPDAYARTTDALTERFYAKPLTKRTRKRLVARASMALKRKDLAFLRDADDNVALGAAAGATTLEETLPDTLDGGLGDGSSSDDDFDVDNLTDDDWKAVLPFAQSLVSKFPGKTVDDYVELAKAEIKGLPDDDKDKYRLSDLYQDGILSGIIQAVVQYPDEEGEP